MRNRLLSILLVFFSGGLFSQQAFGSVLERGFTPFRLSIQAKPEIIVRARYNLVRTAIVVRQAGVDSLFYVYTDRGYTGHEHLPEFALINMNARLYDPALGRFLSPDPFVQNPLLSQNFNRYSYVMNNPLIYTEPIGGLKSILEDIIMSIGIFQDIH